VAIGIEFMIVVLGVYAAFELDRWRDTESARQANAAVGVVANYTRSGLRA
jgi:hypothetical protein